MRYRLLGTTGLRVSELFLGAMTFGDPADRRPPGVPRMLDLYAEAGGNVIDTALDATARARASSASSSTAGATASCSPRSTRSPATTATRTPAATTARTSPCRWRPACGGCAPTTSTCTGCTSGTGTRRSRRRCGRWTTPSAPARSSTWGSPTRRPGSSPAPTPWPSGAAGRRSPASRCPTACCNATSSGSCCRWPRRSG